MDGGLRPRPGAGRGRRLAPCRGLNERPPPERTGAKKVLLWRLDLGKVTDDKAPWLKVQSPGGREGKKPAEGVVREV
jgi:hypothetical protein